MKTKQEELKIKLPIALLEDVDTIIELKSFKSRNDLICYVLRLYVDKIKKTCAIKNELQLAEENL